MILFSDIAPAEFSTQVSLLSVFNDTSGKLQIEEDSESGADCILVWDFKSPAIYPRPNVTCGYYSYDLDDIKTPLPAGLSLHQEMNGSWVAMFQHTQVQVN